MKSYWGLLVVGAMLSACTERSPKNDAAADIDPRIDDAGAIAHDCFVGAYSHPHAEAYSDAGLVDEFRMEPRWTLDATPDGFERPVVDAAFSVPAQDGGCAPGAVWPQYDEVPTGCGPGRWCWSYPANGPSTISDVWAACDTDGLALTSYGSILRYRAGRWSEIRPREARLEWHGIAGSSPTDAWIWGASSDQSGTHARILRWNGTSLEDFALPASNIQTIRSMIANSPTDLWLWEWGSPRLHRWDGTRWSSLMAPASVHFGMCATSENDVWALTSGPTGTSSILHHFDGSSWQARGTFYVIPGLACPAPNTAIVVTENYITQSGTLQPSATWEFRGSTTRSLDAPLFWGERANGGLLRTENGRTLLHVADPSGGRVYQWSNSAWVPIVRSLPGSIGSGVGDVSLSPSGLVGFAGSSKGIGAWSCGRLEAPVTRSTERRVVGPIGEDAGFMVGPDGIFRREANETWTRVSSVAVTTAAWQPRAGELWAVQAADPFANESVLVHVVGSVVTTQRIATASIVAFASSGPDDGWIAGANRELFRWDGSNFVRFAVPVPSSVTLDGLTFAIRSLSGVWSLGPNDLFVSSSEFEPEPLLLQLVGNRWVPSRWASGRARVVALARQDGDLIVLAGGSVWRRRVGMNEHEQAASGSISGMVQLRDGRILLSESWWISVLRRADAAMTGAEGISGSTLTSTGYTSYRLQHASASGSAWLLTDNSGHVVRVNF